MTKQDAGKFWPIIKAYSEGKAVQFNRMPGGWNDIDNPDFGGYVESYRIKPEPKYVPFTFSDYSLLIGKFIKSKSIHDPAIEIIIKVSRQGVTVADRLIGF